MCLSQMNQKQENLCWHDKQGLHSCTMEPLRGHADGNRIWEECVL